MPPNEPQRLAALHALDILDTPEEELFDGFAELAAAICATPMASVNLIDAHRQWSKAVVGLNRVEVPREASFCARTIVSDGGILVVENALADPAWSATSPVGFYAGAAIVDEDGHAVGSVSVADVRARTLSDGQLDGLRLLARQANAALQFRRASRRAATEDPLTGLANRTLLFDRLTQALGRRRRSDAHLGVLFCDLDSFKAINARLGHSAGDDVLRLVAARLEAAARVTDTVARVAADQFVVVCPDLAVPEDLDRIAARLRDAVVRPATIGGLQTRPRMSVGAALAEPGDDADSLLSRADEAMYVAKWRGRLAPDRG